MNTNITIENAFSDGWATFRNHMGSAIGAVLLALLVGSLTFGICIPPLMCGVFMLADNWLTKRNPNAGAGSVFDGFRLFLPSFCAALLMYIGLFVLGVVLLVVPVLGYLASLAVSLIGGALSVWVLMVVANQRIPCLKAVGVVLDATLHGKFWMPILVGVLANVVGAAGTCVCGFGVLFTLPLACCIYAAAYRLVFPVGEEEAAG